MPIGQGEEIAPRQPLPRERSACRPPTPSANPTWCLETSPPKACKTTESGGFIPKMVTWNVCGPAGGPGTVQLAINGVSAVPDNEPGPLAPDPVVTGPSGDGMSPERILPAAKRYM